MLTKPLGSGFLCTAIRGGTLPDDEALAVMEMMAALNRGAAEAMLEVGVHAATDITGFGLIGHAIEMADGSQMTIRVPAADVPWMPGLEAHITKANTCGGLNRNMAYAQGKVDFNGGTPDQHLVLADPQTSGGLLMSVAPDRLDDLLAALEQRGVATRAVVGEVIQPPPWRSSERPLATHAAPCFPCALSEDLLPACAEPGIPRQCAVERARLLAATERRVHLRTQHRQRDGHEPGVPD